MRTTDFQPGMTVMSSDGMPLGQIREIWAHTASHGTLPVSQYLLQDFGPVRGTGDLVTSSKGYLHIQQGNWLSGDRQDLYVPLASVQSIDAAHQVTVKLASTVCRQYCQELPPSLRQAA